MNRENAAHFYGPGVGIEIEIEGRPAVCEGISVENNEITAAFPGGLEVRGKARCCGDLTFWQWELHQVGDFPSPVITGFYPISMRLPCEGALAPTLHGIKGGLNQAYYPPRTFREWDASFITEGLPCPIFRVQSVSGRSSDEDAPWFLIEDSQKNGGWIAALGWSGDWHLTMQRKLEWVTLRAGMTHLNVSLYPGERLLQPEVLIGRYVGESESGQRKLRQTVREHLQPKLAGMPMKPFTFWDSYYGDRGAFTEADILRSLSDCESLGIEYVVLDGGWTGGGEDGEFESLLPHIGSWRPDPRRFSSGLSKLSDAAKKHGRKLGIWFDIEQAHHQSSGYLDYPELFHTQQTGHGCALLRLDTESGLDWAYEAIHRNVVESQAKWIRYDANASPQSFWQGNDASHRKGVTEANHIRNFYRLLDRLREAHPDLLIENCASGGRRMDLGAIRRTHADWISDHTQSEAIVRYHLHGASRWFPAHRLNTSLAHFYLEPNRPIDWTAPLPASAFLSHFGGNLGFSDRMTKLTSAASQQILEFVNLFKETAPAFGQETFVFGNQQDCLNGPTGVGGFDPESGKGALVVFGKDARKLPDDLPEELEFLQAVEPQILDSGNAQFVGSSIRIATAK